MTLSAQTLLILTRNERDELAKDLIMYVQLVKAANIWRMEVDSIESDEARTKLRRALPGSIALLKRTVPMLCENYEGLK